MRGSVRLASLAGLHVIYVWTHDSVGLGEDGPTHQPVEHYAALRAIPNLWFVRPGDANEAAAAWASPWSGADGPVAPRPHPPEAADAAPRRPTRRARASGAAATSCARPSGGADGIDLILIATGSELQLRWTRRRASRPRGSRTRVVSLPCWEAFDRQDQAYRDAVLPPAVRRRLSDRVRRRRLGWERWVGDEGAIIGARPLRRVGAGGHDLRALRVHRGPRRPTSPAVSSAARSAARPVLDPGASAGGHGHRRPGLHLGQRPGHD